MADHKPATGGHPEMDYPEHEKSYELFLVLSKWTTIVTVGILVFMAIVLL